MITVGSAFSGIAGLEQGFAQEGCEIVFQIEVDPACQTILRRHFPDVKLYSDITEVTYERLAHDLGPRANVDVLVGGWPCQDISLAGTRAGLAGERSGLFFEFARLAKEIAPRWLVAENVPGLLSSYSPVEPPPSEIPPGREWEVDETYDLGIVVSTLAELGYVGAWRCFDAQHFGVPQRRRRIFFVCHLGAPFSAPAEVLLERDSSTGDIAAGEEAWEDDAEAVGDGVDETGGLGDGELVSALTSAHGGPDDNMAQAGHLVPQALGVGSESSPDVAGTLGGAGNGRGWNSDLDRMGALVVDEPLFVGSESRDDLARPVLAVPHGLRCDFESENLLIDPRAYTVHAANSTAMTGDGDAQAAFETGVVRSLDTTGGLAAGQGGTVIVEPEPPFAVSMRGREDGNVPEAEPGGVVPALRTGQGGSGNPMVVTEDEPVFTVHNGDDTIWSEGVAQPVIASKGWPGAVTFRKSQRAHDADDCETWEQDDVANTLNAFENHNDRRTTHAIVEPIPVELRMATRTSGATGVGTPGTGFGDEGDPSYPVMASPPPAVQQELSVRRLTPLECTRLQGFPDDWLVSDGTTEEAHARQVLRGMWEAVGTEAGEGRRFGVAVALLTPEVLLEGVYVGRFPWSVVARCVAARGALPGADPWPEAFVRAVRQHAQRGSAPQGREPAEQLARELGGSLPPLSSFGASAVASLQRAGLWEKAQAEWPVRHARSTSEGGKETCGCALIISDSVAYRQVGNAVAVPCGRWIARRLIEVHAKIA